MKSPISELDYGKELFGQNLPDRRYNPNWKKLIPNEEPNTDDENKALSLLKKWYDDEKSPAELTKLFGELLKLKSKFPNVLNPTMGRSTYENNEFFRGTLLPLSHLIKLGGWEKYDGLDFDDRGAIQTNASYLWKPKSSKGFTSVTPTPHLALNFALDYAWKKVKGMWERNILKSLQGKGDTLVPVILVFKDTHPNMIINPIFSNLLSANVESEVILVGKSSKPSYIIIPNFDVVEEEAGEENIKLHNYFKGLKENTMKTSDKQLNESFYNEFVSQFMSEILEDESDSQEIKVGEYQTKYFHVCPGAISLYKDIESKGVDMGMAQRSAMLQDALYFVEKHIQRDGYNPEKDYVMVAKNLAKNIMKLAEMMGLEKEHNYIQGHVDTIEKVVKEKGLEERVTELTEENVPTNPSKWSYYKSQAKKKFDVYPSAYANAWAAKQYKAAGGGWKTKKKESVNEHSWTIDLSEDFLNEWSTPGFKYKSKAAGMSADDLIKLSKKNRGDGTRISFDRTDLQSEITSAIKTFFEKADPFAMKKQFGKTFKLIRVGSIREHYHILEDTPKKKGTQDHILSFFTGEISSPLGVSRQSFSIMIRYRQKGNSTAYIDWSYDGHSNDWPIVKKSKKVWDYYKEAYLAIPDNPEDDKRFVMNRRGVRKVSEFGKYKEIPKSFVSKILEDPVLWLGFEGVPEFGSPKEIQKIFNTLNKKYYKQWQAANREGTKGTLRNIKGWWTSLREHEEYSGITSVNEANEPDIISQLRDIVSKKQNKKLKDPKSGKIDRVDLYSASAVIQVYDALKQQKNKDKFVDMGLSMMVYTAFKLLNKNESIDEAKVSSEDKAYFKKHKKEIMKMIEDDLLLDPVEAIKLHKQKNEATAAEEDESVNERDDYAKKAADYERKRKYDANHVIKSLIATAKENSKQRKSSTKDINQRAAIWGDLDLKPIIKKIKSKGELNTYELADMFPDTIPFWQIESILLDIWFNRFKYLGYGKRYDINRAKKAPWKYIDKSKNEVVDEYDVETIEEMKDFQNFIKEYKADINEAEYQGRDVKLGKIMQGDVKKFKVYVKNDKGNVVKVNFGQKGMTIKKDNPGARKSFRSRMNCDSPGPRWKARYWSCRKW